jgi:hypothetical protein
VYRLIAQKIITEHGLDGLFVLTLAVGIFFSEISCRKTPDSFFSAAASPCASSARTCASGLSRSDEQAPVKDATNNRKISTGQR